MRYYLLIAFFTGLMFCANAVNIFKYGYSIYQNNTMYYIDTYKVFNNSSSNMIMWFCKDNADQYEEKELIRDYFFKRSSDGTCFYHIITENLCIFDNNSVSIENTFLKKIKPNEAFEIHVMRNSNMKQRDWESKIVLIEEQKLYEYLGNPIHEQFFFDINSIIINDSTY